MPLATTDKDATAAMQDMAAAFASACARTDSVFERHFRIGGRLLRMRVAGPSLAETITAAFSHLEVAHDGTAAPELTVDLWDAAETGTPRPIQYFRDVFHRTWPFGMSVLASSRDEGVIGLQSHQSATMLDRRAGCIVGWVASADRLSLFERGKPLQPLLFAWHSDCDTVPVHAGFVALEGNGVLLGGSGGSGKSTTALLCLRDGFDYLGDDYIGLPPAGDAGSRGHSFYNSTWLDPDRLDRTPWLAEHAIRGTPRDDKLLVLLGDLFADRMAAEARVRVLALPRVALRTETTFTSASRGEALLRLAPSSILQLPFIRSRQALDRMSELAGETRAYWLDLGTDLEQIPGRVHEMLDEACAA